MVERLAARYPNVTVGWTPGRAVGRVVRARAEAAPRPRLPPLPRSALRETPHLRGRSRGAGAAGWSAGSRRCRCCGTPVGRRALAWVLRQFEQAVPRSRELEAFYREQAPDVVLITPLVDIGSPQLDHFAARARARHAHGAAASAAGITCRASRCCAPCPDRVIGLERDAEAAKPIELHGVPADRVVVTGAQCYDQWFGRAPSRSREEFCAHVGLRSDAAVRPLRLLVALPRHRERAARSSSAGSSRARQRRSAAARTSASSIRPHPARLDEWQQVDLTGVSRTSRSGAPPGRSPRRRTTTSTRCTTAPRRRAQHQRVPRGGVVGKPVLTVLLPEISRGQPGRHASLPLPAERQRRPAAKRRAASTSTCAQLAATLADRGGGDRTRARFVDGFIRPFGLDEPRRRASPSAIEAVGAAAGAGARPAAPRAAWIARVPAAAVAGVRAARAPRTQPWRKETRYKYRRFRRHARKQVVPEDPAVRGRAAEADRRRGAAASCGRQSGAILTPKLDSSAIRRRACCPRRPGSRGDAASWSRCSGAAAGRSSSGRG